MKMAFEERFETKLPDELNLGHRMLVVAESIDAATMRIVRYLSDMNVPINVATSPAFHRRWRKEFFGSGLSDRTRCGGN